MLNTESAVWPGSISEDTCQDPMQSTEWPPAQDFLICQARDLLEGGDLSTNRVKYMKYEVFAGVCIGMRVDALCTGMHTSCTDRRQLLSIIR